MIVGMPLDKEQVPCAMLRIARLDVFRSGTPFGQ
jgi:hypothetical protein